MNVKCLMKMFLTIVFVLGLVSTVLVQAGDASKNQITFKPGSKAANGYIFAADSGVNYTGIWDSGRGYDRNKGVLGIKCEESGGYGSWEMNPAPKFEPGKEYELDLMTWHTKMPKGDFLCVEVYAFTATDQPLLLLHGLYKDLPKQWYQIKTKFTVPANAVKLRIRFDLTTPGEVYFDQLNIQRTDNKPTVNNETSNNKSDMTPQGDSDGLVGLSNLVIQDTKKAPNGYIFYTEHPEIYTGIWDTTRGWGNNRGVIGIKSSKPGNFASWEVSPSPKCEPGMKYTVDAMVWHSKLPAGSFICVEVYAFTADNTPTILLHGLYKDLPKQWYRVSEKFTVPADAVKLRIRFDLTTPGEVYFDDIHVTQESSETVENTTPAPANLTIKIPFTGWRDLFHELKGNQTPRRLVLVDGLKRSGEDTPVSSIINSDDGIKFNLVGEASKIRAMKWENTLAQPMLFNDNRYAILRYKADGIARVNPKIPLFELRGHNPAGERAVFEIINSAQALNDGRTHTLVRKIDTPINVNKISSGIITENDCASFVVNDLSMVNDLPINLNSEVKTIPSIDRKLFTPISLNAYYNNSLAGLFEIGIETNGVIIDGLKDFPSSQIEVSGAPFEVNLSTRNIISPVESTGVMEEKIDCLGTRVSRKHFRPVSRDDKIIIPVKAKASEVLLLLALLAPSEQERFALPNRPLKLDDIENIAVELVYDSGERELAFPYSLADRGSYIPYRMLGAYAVAANPAASIKEIILHNNMFGINFSIAGITLNSGAMLAPELRDFVKPVATKRTPEPQSRDKYITHTESVLTLENSYYKYKFNLEDGFSLIDIVDRRQSDNNSIKLSPSSGLMVRIDNTIYTGRCFKVNSIKASNNQVSLSLMPIDSAALPLEINIILKVDDSPSLSFNVEAINIGSNTVEPTICFPAFNDVMIGAVENTRLFFPQYRHIDSAEKMSLRALYGLEFQFQFMDIYNPNIGSGLMTMVKNTDLRIIEYVMTKNDLGVSSNITFPAESNSISAGGKIIYPEVCSILHDGDWRQATDVYSKYLSSWYKPVKSQDKNFFLNAVDVKAYISGQKLSALINNTPPVLSKDKSNFRWNEVFDIEKDHLGHVPDIVHFFDWFHDNENNREQYGCYASEKTYAQVGGLPLFRKAINDIQDEYKSSVSLYTLYDRFNTYASPASSFSLADAICAPNGAPIASTTEIYPCPASEKWNKHVMDDIIKLQKDTGAKIIYLDVFSSFGSRRCYSKDHGHPVPSNPLITDSVFISKLRDTLPADVAIWTEYPFPDQTSLYTDGSIHYYFKELSNVFARPYNISDKGAVCAEMPFNLTRYLTPKYRQFLLPCGIEGGRKPSQVDAAFFHGEGFHEVTWRLHESRTRQKLNRSYQIRKKYRDCFSTDKPEPLILTEAGGIIANRFPGTDRTVWTVYNTRPNTYSGHVLSLDHVPGARYIDAWNDCVLTPEIKDGKAIINLTIHPQQPGCIVQEKNNDM